MYVLILLFAQVASDVEPPVADEHQLTELGAVGTEECRLPAIDVAVVPALAARLWISVEAWVGLLVAVEVRVRHRAQHWIIGARPSYSKKK